MEIVLNSKFFPSLSVEELGEKVRELGYDGIDLNIRPGHPVDPENVADTLPGAVRAWSAQGLVCPLATAPVDMVDPSAPEVERIYAACADADVPRFKIGFWRFDEGDDYWRIVDRARAALDAFASLSERFGVQTCYQIHSGPCIGSNCAGLMHLIRGFDPDLVGAYPDVGHLALDGEDLPMGLGMIRDHLSIVAVKDPYYAPQPEGSSPAYVPRFTKVGQGCVDWPRCFRTLRALGFDGPLTVHTEYDFDESVIRQVGYAETTPPNLEEWAKEDAAYLRALLKDTLLP